MIKAVIFDVGGVIVRSGDRNEREKWERLLGLKEWQSEDIVFNSEMGIKAQMGEISDHALWTWVAERFELSSDKFDEFHDDFWADNKVDQDLMTMIRALRVAYRTAIISNATDTLREDLAQRYQIADAFDLIVCSAEEKIMKPSPEIYERTLNRLELEPLECIFIDDMEINVAAARDLGLEAIVFTPTLDLSTELQSYGVKIGG